MEAIKEYWPIVAFALAAVWSLTVWMKRQFLDNVYATKKEVEERTGIIEDKIAAHEKSNVVRYIELQKTINKNHDEMKDLVISTMKRD